MWQTLSREVLAAPNLAAPPHPDPLPRWGEGIRYSAPHPDPLPRWGEGIRYSAPHPDPLPRWGEGIRYSAPHPDRLPRWGEGILSASAPSPGGEAILAGGRPFPYEYRWDRRSST